MSDLDSLAAAAGNQVPDPELDHTANLYVYSHGMEYGPVSQAEAFQWLKEGRIDATAHVRPYGYNDWYPIQTYVPLPLIPSAPAPCRQPQAGGFVQTMNNFAYGAVNPKMHCPHCQCVGKVRTKKIDKRVGISGTKAAAAILTSGVSMLATGLSRHEKQTEARCDNCGNVWHF